MVKKVTDLFRWRDENGNLKTETVTKGGTTVNVPLAIPINCFDCT